MLHSTNLKGPSWEIPCVHEEYSVDIVKSIKGDFTKLYDHKIIFNGPCPDEDHALILKDFLKYKDLNSKNLRSDELTSDHKAKSHILFTGCSQTFGFGILEKESLWSQIVLDNIPNNSGYFNIARPGNSISEIIFDIYKYVDLYGIPNKIFCLLPEMRREMMTYGTDITKLSEKEIDTIEFFQKKLLIVLIGSLQNFCKARNIELHFATWDPPTEEFLRYSKVEGMTNLLNNKNLDRMFWLKDLQEDGHWGKKHNKAFANMILGKI